MGERHVIVSGLFDAMQFDAFGFRVTALERSRSEARVGERHVIVSGLLAAMQLDACGDRVTALEQSSERGARG